MPRSWMAGLLIAALAGVACAESLVIDHGSVPAAVPGDALARAARRVVLFGHQSVGQNILDAVREIAPAVPVTSLADGDPAPLAAGITAFPVGENGDARGKIDDFRGRLERLPGRIDVAMMKLCYVDTPPEGEVEAVLRRHAGAMEALARKHPETRLVWWTQPLEREGNHVRQALNARIRAWCREHGATLFDIADIESHHASGEACVEGGAPALCPEYTEDGGHLNGQGATRVARALLALLARLDAGASK